MKCLIKIISLVRQSLPSWSRCLPKLSQWFTSVKLDEKHVAGVLLMLVTQVLIQNVCSINTLIRESGHKSVQQVATRNVKQLHETNGYTLRFITVVFISDICELSHSLLLVHLFVFSEGTDSLSLLLPYQSTNIILHALTANNQYTAYL